MSVYNTLTLLFKQELFEEPSRQQFLQRILFEVMMVSVFCYVMYNVLPSVIDFFEKDWDGSQ